MLLIKFKRYLCKPFNNFYTVHIHKYINILVQYLAFSAQVPKISLFCVFSHLRMLNWLPFPSISNPKLTIYVGGEVSSDAASSFGMWPGLQPHISTCNLSVSPSWPPAPFINSCHQASLWSARLSLKCQRCTQASSSYIFLLFWSFCFPAGQLRQFWPAWPVAGHFQPLPILSPNNLQYIRWGGREESADSLLHISIPELPAHIFFTFPGQQLSLLFSLQKIFWNKICEEKTHFILRGTRMVQVSLPRCRTAG